MISGGEVKVRNGGQITDYMHTLKSALTVDSVPVMLLKSLVDSIPNCSHSGDTQAGATAVVTSGVVTVVVVASGVVAKSVVVSPLSRPW